MGQLLEMQRRRFGAKCLQRNLQLPSPALIAFCRPLRATPPFSSRLCRHLVFVSTAFGALADSETSRMQQFHVDGCQAVLEHCD